ncbi:hypothetical protein AAF463_23500 (plasmid) [Pantoea sp. BJ2]|uniref:ADF-H domain-containing protein n=1 Tax=Pantoea sp. BJ2 TaxID=3141322 RepID=A0AAU7U3P6_9GAMM
MKSILSSKLEAQMATFFLFRYKAIIIKYDQISDIFVSESAFLMGEHISVIVNKLPANDVRYIIMRFIFCSSSKERNDSLMLEWDPELKFFSHEKKARSESLQHLIKANKMQLTYLSISSHHEFDEPALLQKLDSLNQAGST